MTSKPDFNDLETMIDQHGLDGVLAVIAQICEEKAMWVESSESIGTPDKILGREWRRNARAIEKIARAVDLP